MKIKLLIFITLAFVGLQGLAQEFLTGFSNGTMTNADDNGNVANQNKTRSVADNKLSLPFFDDFTGDGSLDAVRWKKRNVLVNSGFTAFPINFNAATFDVLDEVGRVYPHASSNPFVADSLISNPISLIDEDGNKLSPADSLYFSFYFQPQGKGDAPEPADSLVLMFGYEIDTFRIEYDTVFVYEMLEYMQVDTIYAGDILYHDMNSTCKPDMFTISQGLYTIEDSLTKIALPCDTVFYTEMIWDHIWSTEGMSLDSFLLVNNSSYFKQVMIPVTKNKYFEKEMFILFYNYGSIATAMYPNDRSNVDNWNIDFLYLDKNRSYDDTSYPLITFSEKSPSLLKRYSSMPYRQYKSNPTVAMSTGYKMYLANMDTAGASAQYSCLIENLNSGWTFNYNGDWSAVSSFDKHGIHEYQVQLKNFLYDMDDNSDVATYRITHVISVDEESSSAQGDTLVGMQILEDYYAYDDGTPEKGYGVVPDDSYFATQFTISTPDTLCGVHLLFNRTYNDANYDFFDIVVWNDNNGRPGNEIYRIKNQRPIWNEEEIYKFGYYPFDKVLKVNGTIYVGIMQHSRESINIGFDTSVDNSQYNFFETGDGWLNSQMKGSLMIRPVLGGDYTHEEENNTNKNRLGLYPVPSKDEVNISELPADACEEIMIFDMTGRIVKRFNYDVNLNVSDLANGLYMIRVVTEDGKSYTEKFLISK